MSRAEDELAYQLDIAKIPYEREAQFIPGRRFRADFLFRDMRLVVEVQGGIWMGESGHKTGRGLSRDYEKYNLAVLGGWNVLQVTPKDVDSGVALRYIEDFISRRCENGSHV